MPNPTIATLAASVLAASGTPTDKPPTRLVLLAMARTLEARAGCHLTTARRYMWRAWANAHNGAGQAQNEQLTA